MTTQRPWRVTSNIIDGKTMYGVYRPLLLWGETLSPRWPEGWETMISRTRKKRIDRLFTNGHSYTALEAGPAFNFRWAPAQVREVIRLWDASASIYTMAERYDRDPDEVAVLIMDLVRRGVIEERRGGATGKRKEVAA